MYKRAVAAVIALAIIASAMWWFHGTVCVRPDNLYGPDC
jgi:hypothetical protein